MPRKRRVLIYFLFAGSSAVLILCFAILSLLRTNGQVKATTAPGAVAAQSESSESDRPVKDHADVAESPLSVVGAPSDAIIESQPLQEVLRRERREIYDRLRLSGASVEPWTDTARESLATWRSHSTVDQATASNKIECFTAGCTAFFSYSDVTSYSTVVASLMESESFRSWAGGKIVTGPVKGVEGAITNLVVLLAPNKQ